MEKLTFQGEDGTTEEFYVLEQTRVGGVNYGRFSKLPGYPRQVLAFLRMRMENA